MRRSALILILLVSGIGSTILSAQDTESQMADGILAFRDSRYLEAVASFENVIEAKDQNSAEAHFLLARIYFETSLDDRKRAEKELDAALKIEPANVKYMVALMQSLRVDSWNFFQKRTREAKRFELAKKILKIDEKNAFAHQELGKSYIRDFWRYRNAIVYPSLLFARSKYRAPSVRDPLANFLSRQEEAQDFFSPDEDPDEFDIDSEVLTRVSGMIDPQSIMLSDQFDVGTLEAQGINVQDLSGRADRVYTRAVGHLLAAIDSDPRQRSAYTDLMRIYSLKGEYQDALLMLEQMYLYFPEDPELWTYLGFTHYHSGNLAAAAKVFETSLQYLDEDALYAYTNLDLILPEDEMEQYEADSVAYTARYWTSKDPRLLTPYNERKLEHYARLTYADLLYGAPELDLRGWNTERGQIIVRYGAPIGDLVIIPKSSSRISESFRALPSDPDPNNEGDGSQILQITRDGYGFDMFEEANTYNIWTYEDKKFVFEDPFRNGEYRLYSPSANDISQGSLPWLNDYAIRAREIFREQPESYTYKAPGRQIDVPFLVASFKNFSSDMTDVYVNYGIPVNDFDPSDDIIDLTANAGMFVVSENRDMLVEQRRTIYGLRTAQVVRFEESNLWIDTEHLRVPPGMHEVSVEFETAGAATVAVQRREVEILDFSGDELALSDLLLAYRIDEAEFGTPTLSTDIVRNGLSIMPAPWSVFSIEQPIYLYFEVYNLDLDSDGNANYLVEAALGPKKQGGAIKNFFKGIFGGGNDGVAVSLPYQVASENDGQYLILDATNQEPGLYTLVLQITDQATGKHLEREQDLFLE